MYNDIPARRTLDFVVKFVVLVLVLSLIVGSFLGQPTLVSWVETGSMEPALNPGNGFVAIPAQLSGDIKTGDIIVFRAKEIQGGGLTTHRIVAETERGYITQGDNNPFTDQDGGEPPVKDPQIVAVAWQPGGSVLAVPGVGSLLTTTTDVLTAVQRQLAMLLGMGTLLGTQGLAYLLFGLAVIAYAVDVVFSDERGQRERQMSRDSGLSARLIVGVFAAAIVLAATATMVAPAGSQQFDLVSSEFDSESSGVIQSGTSESLQRNLGNGGFVPVVSYLEPTTDKIEIQPRKIVIPGRSTANATLTISAPPETGYYPQYLVEYRYLLVLPRPLIGTLYEVHPWLPIVAIDALIGVPFYLLGVTLVGTGRIRSRSRDAPSRLTRLRSLLFFKGKDP